MAVSFDGVGAGGEAAGAAAVPATMAMGFGMAQEMMKGMSQPSSSSAPAAAPPAGGLDVLTPEQAAQALGVSVEDVMASITAGELKARKIGSAWRIARASLEDFLKGG